MSFYCQSCGAEQLQAPTSVASALTQCKCGSSSFATWKPWFLTIQPAPSQTGTPRTDDALVDVDQFSHDERQQWRRDLARQLERELAEAKHERDMANDEFAEARKTSYLERAEKAELALSQAKRDAERLALATYSLICESNGIGDNEWELPQGIARCEFPVASYCAAIKEASEAIRPFDAAIDAEMNAALAKREGEGN